VYIIVHTGKLLKHFNAFESNETLEQDEMLQMDRRGSTMLAIDRKYIKVRSVCCALMANA